MTRKLLAALLCAAPALPASAAISREELRKALEANPDLVIEALRKDKTKFFDFVVECQQDYQRKKQVEEAERAKKELDDSFKNPLKPDMTNLRVRGDAGAAITIVEYSDFQCPYCKRGFNNIEALRKKYGSKLRVAFKNMPLPMHPLAKPAAEYFEAIALKSSEKAWTFHDKIFQNQDKLSEEYLKQLVKDLGLDAEKIAKDAKSEAVKNKIEADVNEAQKFGIEGTPAYIINGVPLRGAYPVESFDEIIERHLKG